MNKEELVYRLDGLEWEDFEVKEAQTNIPKSTWETISSFSNTGGGWIIFGVKQKGDKFEIIGVNNPEKIEQDFTTTLRGDKFNKKIIAKCEKFEIENKIILAFYIPLSGSKPIYFNTLSNTFIRTGSGDQRATRSEIDAMFRDSAFGTKDRELTQIPVKKLDSETITRFRTYLRNIDPGHRYNTFPDKKLLEKIGAVRDNKATYAGLLFFGNEDIVSEVFYDFRIDYFEIPGTSYADSPVRYNYRLREEPNLLAYYFSIMDRLLRKIDIPFKLRSDGFADSNQDQVAAIREALVNLLMHTDYFSPMKPRIRVFFDRFEFFNPGALPRDFDSIRKEDISLPRNPILAKIFRVLKLAENAGYGFDKMFEGWNGYYSNFPVVSSGIDYFKIVFKLGDRGLNDIEDRVGDRVGEKVGDRVGEKLTDNQEKILEIIKRDPLISANKISDEIGISSRKVEENIKKLKEKGIIKRIGPAKGGYWELIKR